jgi:uncharacterized membrane protein
MTTLIAGLALFLGIHLLPAVPPVRAAAVGALGANRYKALFALASAVGLVLIVVGYSHAGAQERLFAPFPAAKAAAPYLVTAAFILFAAANMRGYLRRWLQHPMLLGLLLWSGTHLLANGDRTGTVLFGAFFAYAVVDLASALARHAVKPFEPAAKFDLMAIGGGIVAAGAVMHFHRWLFGVPAVAFGG